MTELDRSLRELAERGDARGAHAVLDAARDRPPSRRRPAFVLAAAVLLAAAAIAGSLLTHRSTEERDVIAAASVSVVIPTDGTPVFAPIVGVQGVLIGVGDTGVVVRSEDAGRTWQQLDFIDAAATVTEVHLAGTTVVITLTFSGSTATSTPSTVPATTVVIWTSTDGLHWRRADRAPAPVEPEDWSSVLERVRTFEPPRTGEVLLTPVRGDDQILVPVVDRSERLARVLVVHL